MEDEKRDTTPERDQVVTGTWFSPKYSFVWTAKHLSSSTIEALRKQHDELGSETLGHIQRLSKSELNNDDCPVPRIDVFMMLAANHKNEPILASLWNELNTVPSWVDWSQLERAQKIFCRYAAANIVGFALQGFLGETAGVSGPAEVLSRSGGFSKTRVLPRLIGTFEWLLEVTASVESIKPGGAAWRGTVRLRFLHASVRHKILSIASKRAGYWDAGTYGVPANTLDSIHSISVFSCSQIFLQLPMFGIKLTQQEVDDYIALFRYLAYLLGTPQEYFATTAQARATMESMLLFEVQQPTQTGKMLVSNILQAIEDWPPANISRSFIEAGARVLNGDPTCDDEGLGRPGWSSYLAFEGFCWVVCGLAKVQQTFPMLDAWFVSKMRESLHGLVVRAKNELKSVNEKGTERQEKKSVAGFGLVKRPVETFLVSVVLLGYAGTACVAAVSMYFIFVWHGTEV